MNPTTPEPRQAPLFTLPPIAEATGWRIEFRWKDGEIDATGSPKPTCWFPFSTYKDHKKAKNALRSLRYGQRRKLFRIAPFLFTHQGDIECHVPLPPAAAVLPKQGSGQGSDPLDPGNQDITVLPDGSVVPW